MITHYKDSPWDKERWPNFDPSERHLHCDCCGEFYYDPESMDMLQKARTKLDKPMVIYSGHRCEEHNKAVGGAERSEHLKIAFDISTNGHDREELIDALRYGGFSTFGFYKTFVHTDKRPGRRWVGQGALDLWRDIV